MKRLAWVVHLSLLWVGMAALGAWGQSPADLPGTWAVGQGEVTADLLQVTPPAPAPAELSLQDAVKLGLARNIGFRATIQNLLDARSRYYVARQRWDLTLTGNAQHASTRDQGVTTTVDTSDLGGQFDYAALTGGTFSVTTALDHLSNEQGSNTTTISLQQPLLAGAGAASTAYETLRSARNGYREALLQYYIDRQNLIVSIIAAYFNAVEQQQLLDVQAANVRSAEQQVKDEEARFEAQLVVRLDLLQVQLQLASAHQAQISAQQAAQDAMDQLLALCGLQVGGAPPLVTAVPYKPVSVDPEAVVKEALERRPELQLDRLAIEDRTAAVRINRSQSLPTLNAFGNFQEVHQDAIDDSSRGWMFGLNLSAPIGSRNLVEQVRRARWALLVAQQQLLDEGQQVVASVRTQMRAAASAQAQTDIAMKNLEVASLSVYDANLMVQEGLSTTLYLVNAQTSLVQTQTSVVQSRVGYYLATMRLRQAMGEDVAADLPTERAVPGQGPADQGPAGGRVPGPEEQAAPSPAGGPAAPAPDVGSPTPGPGGQPAPAAPGGAAPAPGTGTPAPGVRPDASGQKATQ